MKKQLSNRPRFKINRGIKGLLMVVITGSLLCLDSCKKDGRSDGLSPQAVSKTSALQSTAYKVLKAHASSAEFSDLDWNSTTISNLNGKPYLLRIKSKSDNTKQLLYSKKNGVTHARWVQLKSGTSASAGSIVVSSLNETNIRESLFQKGRILSTRVIKTNSQNNSQPTSSSKSSNGLAATVPVSSSGSTTAGGIRIRALQLDDEEDGGGDDGGGDDGGGDDGGGFDGGDDGGGDDGGGDTSDPGSTDPGFTWTGVNQLPEVTVTATADNSSVNLYSLYILMGDNSSYDNEYTTDPNAGSDGGGTGTVVTLVAHGGIKGTDPAFKPNQKSGTPLLKDTPSSLAGEVVGFKYTIAPNGTISVSDINATLGGVTLGNTFTMANSSYTITGTTINITVTGQDNYNLFVQGIGTVFTDRISISETYNTQTGAYTMTATRL